MQMVELHFSESELLHGVHVSCQWTVNLSVSSLPGWEQRPFSKRYMSHMDMVRMWLVLPPSGQNDLAAMTVHLPPSNS